MAFSAGGRVAARGLVWDVLGVETLGRQQQLLQLRCAAGDLRGMRWDLMVPHETATPLHGAVQPEQTSPLQTWRLHHIACLLDQLPGPSALVASVPRQVALEPYQLVPVLRALEMPRPRLLLADGVGLGKTIQAGLIATELLARRRAHRILVVTPAGPLLRQWDQELRQRFGLRFTALADAASLQAERRRLELGGNPFDSVSLCLTAIDFAKQERVLEELERSAWDLVVIDEAHHCVGAHDTEATQRRRLAEVLARRSDGLLLLTATPHDGHDAHFGSLLALLDPSLVDDLGLPAGSAYRNHVVRRLKQHVTDPRGRPLFQERQVLPIAVQVLAEPARQFHIALSALVAPRLGRAGGEALAFVSLLKRSLSTLAACVATLRVVAARLGGLDQVAARERTRALRAYRRKLERYGVLEAADEAELAELEAEDVAARLQTEEAAALQRLIALGEAAIPHDPKLAALVAQIRIIRTEAPLANVLVYTEYADSQAAALAALQAAAFAGEILAISGEDDEATRAAAAERCAAVDGVILVSTDSLAEGLNLHQRCRDLIHLDLPYNPNRLEQRNGRIDRYGQRAEPRMRYLYLAGTFEEQLLLRLIGKFEKARAALDVMPDTLGVTADPAAWEAALFEGFAERQASLFEDAPPVIRTLDRAAEALDLGSYRALRQEIDRAYEGFERMAVRHGWLPDPAGRSGAAQLATASRAHRRGERLLGCIDLGAFLRDAVTAVSDEAAGFSGPGLLAHAAWATGLEGLPGYDPVDGTIDADSIGRVHPLAQRAITAMRQAVPVVAEAAAGSGAPTLLLTYAAEVHGPDGLAWQRVLAVHLGLDGEPEVLQDPSQWLHFGEPASPPANPGAAVKDRLTRRTSGQTSRSRSNDHGSARRPVAPSPGDAWRRHFAVWAAPRIEQAEAAVSAVASSLAAILMSGRVARAEKDEAALAAWLRRRANVLCGPPRPITHDLFAPPSDTLDWRSEPDPARRLALYAAAADTPPARRQSANDLIAIAQDRRRQTAQRLTLGDPVLRPLGMLMRVP